MPRPPNILFIMTDEQRHDCLGLINPDVHTPHFNQLAHQSLVFERAYTPNPSCIPARAAIFTGKVPSRCGAPTFITPLPATETTFQSLLRAHGYHTAVVGKQHFAGSQIERGYDYEEILDSHMPPRDIAAAKDANTYCRHLHDHGFRHADELSDWQDRYHHRWKVDQRFHVDDFVGERGLTRLDACLAQSKPWYLTVSFPGPHMPYDGAGLPQDKHYEGKTLRLPDTSYADLAQKPAYYQRQRESGNPGKSPTEGITPQEIHDTRRAYYANQTLIDEKIGLILDHLRQSGHYDDTLIIYTSDHGDYMGDFGLMGKGQYLSEVLMRVPFLLKPPVPAAPPRTIREFVSLVDIAPTFLDEAGIPIPEDWNGRTLAPLWRDDHPAHADAV